jgi:uncharacterized LabA/DUF88 family protein
VSRFIPTSRDAVVLGTGSGSAPPPFSGNKLFKPLYAILIDGAFLTKKLQSRNRRPATADDILRECERLQALQYVSEYELLRIYFYDASPASGSVRYPVSRRDYNLSGTDRFRNAQRLHDQLVLKPHFALRMGEVTLSPNTWRIKPRAAAGLIRSMEALRDDHFELDLTQKGVDMRIGMDMARLALKEMVRAVIVVTGDSDFVPSFKFVRREGVKVFLDPMGHNVRLNLRQHSDIVIEHLPAVDDENSAGELALGEAAA